MHVIIYTSHSSISEPDTNQSKLIQIPSNSSSQCHQKHISNKIRMITMLLSRTCWPPHISFSFRELLPCYCMQCWWDCQSGGLSCPNQEVAHDQSQDNLPLLPRASDFGSDRKKKTKWLHPFSRTLMKLPISSSSLIPKGVLSPVLSKSDVLAVSLII